MALVTRCTHAGCGTLFRVTVAQLQAHGGQVRCGQCGEVFDAFPTLTTVPDASLGAPSSGDAWGVPAASAPARGGGAPEPTGWDRPAEHSIGQPSPPAPGSVPVDPAEVTLPLHTGQPVPAARGSGSDPTPAAPALSRPAAATGMRTASPHSPTASLAGAPATEIARPRETPAQREAEPAPTRASVDPRVSAESTGERPDTGPARPVGAATPAIASAGGVPPAVGEPEPLPGADLRSVTPAGASGRAMEPGERKPSPGPDGASTGAQAQPPRGPADRPAWRGATDSGQPVPEGLEAEFARQRPPSTETPSQEAPRAGLPAADVPASLAPEAARPGRGARAGLLGAILVLAAGVAAWLLVDPLPEPLAGWLPQRPPLAVSLALVAVLAGLALRPLLHKESMGWVLVGVLSASLLLQAALAWRAEVASRYPGWRPVLEALCTVTGCTVGLPRASRDLAIESSELLALDAARPQLIQLVATVRNRGDLRVALPAIELTLLDAQDRPLARRVLLPAQYVASGVDPDAGVRPGEEFSVRLTLDTTDLRPVGYRLYLFHP